MSILYLCDRKACEHCSPECKYTADISHAKNFERGQIDNETYIEQFLPLFVFKTDAILCHEVKQRVREELARQVETGVVFCDGTLEPVVIDGDLYTVTISKKEG